MSSSLPSEEIASDFRDALQDLQLNVKWEINNLTMIAKENIEHAMAISRTLEQHIKKTTPERKLPSLYVLDSIVKNVGTPYTLYLGRNLYSTFMDAYTLVDSLTRRAMDSMLKTWKEPVPGSIDPKPVFPVDVTRSIENALIKARTVFHQQQHQNYASNQAHQQQQAANRQFHALPPRPAVAANGGPLMRDTRSPSLTPQTQAPPLMSGHQPPPSQSNVTGGYSQQHIAPDRLNQDLNSLITAAQTEFAARPFDQNVQKRLKALLDLQQVLSTQRLPPDQLMMVKNQIDQLTFNTRRSPVAETPQTHTPVPPQHVPNVQQQPTTSYLTQNTIPRPSSATPQVSAHQPPRSSSLDLASLLASANSAASHQPPVNNSPFPNLAAMLGQQRPSDLPTPTAQQPSSLLDSLMAAGLMPSANPPSRPSSTTNQQPSIFAPGFRSLVATPPIPAARTGRAPLNEMKNDIRLNIASLRIARPQLVGSLFSALPSQCSTCGRRFPATAEGREIKARHLDAHFRTNRKIADAATRTGSSRSWFCSELEWIRYRETDEGEESGGAEGKEGKTGGNQVSSGARPETKVKFVKAPADATVAGHTCPICQEKFETVWHDGAQEWVWMDAEIVGGRVYHASCRAEIMGDAGKAENTSRNLSSNFSTSTQINRRGSATPDSILGKRKAEGGMVAEEDLSFAADGTTKAKRRAAIT